MHPYLRSAVGLLVAVSIASLMARHFGWYDGYAHTDTLLHIASGIAFGFLWLWLNKEHPSRSESLLFISIIATAALLSVTWEFWEYFGHLLRPNLTQFYHPELGDTLCDIASGMLGGFVAFVLHIW